MFEASTSIKTYPDLSDLSCLNIHDHETSFISNFIIIMETLSLQQFISHKFIRISTFILSRQDPWAIRPVNYP